MKRVATVLAAGLVFLSSVMLSAQDTVCIIGTGDIMLGTNYPSLTYLPPGEDCSPLLHPVHHVLHSGDLLFGNLEGVFCAEGGTPKECKDTTRCYVFRMPDHFGRRYREVSATEQDIWAGNARPNIIKLC